MFDFASTPTIGQTTVAPNGATFVWDGAKWTTPLNAAAAAGGDASDDTVLASGSTTPRILADRFAENVNVKDFGAKGDGSDDRPGFAAALAHVAGGGKLVVPAGGYNISGPLSQAITGTVTLEGAGSGNTILYFYGAGDGLTFSLPGNENVHVSGFTIVRNFAGGTYANSALVVTTPGSGAGLHYGQTSFRDLVFIGGSYFWQNQMVVTNCQNTTFEHIYGVLPNANGTGTGATGILIQGQSSSSYLTEAKFNDVGFQGGSIGLQIGDWVQGVYLVNCSFAGNDYGIRWSGVSGDADVWFGIANCHFNSGTRGVMAYQAEGTEITNTYNLHYGIPSIDGVYAAFELYNMDGGLLSNNNIYCNGSASLAGTEYGIYMSGGNNCIVTGNRIDNPKNAGVYINATTSTMVAGNIGSNFATGIPLIQYGALTSSNQALANQRNGVADLAITGSILMFGALPPNAANDAAAAAAGVPVGGQYRNGSALMVRVA